MRLITLLFALAAYILPFGVAAQDAPLAGTTAVNRSRLPDIAGVRVGMSQMEAHKAIGKHFGLADKFGGIRYTFHPGPSLPGIRPFTDAIEAYKPAPTDLSPNATVASLEPPDHFVVDLTWPPNDRGVWHVYRVAKVDANFATLLAAVREKYGKELIAVSGGTFHNPLCCSFSQTEKAVNDVEITRMLWVFDEQGQPVTSLNLDTFVQSGCTRSWDPRAAQFANQMAEAADASAGHNIVHMGDGGPDIHVVTEPTKSNYINPISQLSQTSCAEPVIVLMVQFEGKEIIHRTITEMADIGMARRAFEATLAWNKADAEKNREKQIEKSKKVKPSL